MITNQFYEEKDFSTIDEDIRQKCEKIQETYGDAELANLVKELLFVFYHSRDGLYVVDGEGITLRVNPAYETLTGFNAEQFLNRDVRELEREGYFYPSVASEVLETRKTKTIIQEYKTGGTALVTGSPIYDENGKVIRVISNIRDISELAKLYEELLYNKNLVNQYSKMIADMNSLERQGFIAESEEMITIVETAKRVANVDSNILILGESGVGKGNVAKLIASLSDRSDKPFITVNCSAIPEQLMESELFGYAPGAFTGASKTGKMGLIEAANGGVLFLDEIADVPLQLQSKLLLFMESKEVTRVGAVKATPVDVRIIAATNADLWERVKAKQYREDLYYRLNVIPIHVPPLRQRQGDIIPMCSYFLSRINKKNGTKKTISPEVMELLLSYPWPGNVRQLKNLLERVAVLSMGDVIKIEDLPKDFLQKGELNRQADGISDIEFPFSIQNKLDDIEKRWIKQAMEQGGSIRRSAELLGLTPSSLYRKLKKYDIDSKAEQVVPE